MSGSAPFVTVGVIRPAPQVALQRLTHLAKERAGERARSASPRGTGDFPLPPPCRARPQTVPVLSTAAQREELVALAERLLARLSQPHQVRRR